MAATVYASSEAPSTVGVAQLDVHARLLEEQPHLGDRDGLAEVDLETDAGLVMPAPLAAE